MRVLPVAASLDYRAVDSLYESVLEPSEASKTLIDLRHLRWVDPAGMVALLSAGSELAKREGHRARLSLPESQDVTGYLARMGFFEAATPVFDFDTGARRRSGRSSDVLLEITSIAENSDVHAVVGRVQQQAGAILSKTLKYPPSAVVQFSVILSEVCQNIIEHAESRGWVAAQAYNWAKRLGREVLVIAVGDLGRGFRGSLADEHAGRFGDRWGDATALEAAFIHGLTRFPDSGRGHGIQQIRKQVRRWDGFISMRSGTARIADVPDWEEHPPLETDLSPFPGAQITLVLPARVEDA